MFPTIGGRNCPFESGQSDVARPASLLVTSAPAMIRKNVAQPTRMANRLRPLLIYTRAKAISRKGAKTQRKQECLGTRSSLRLGASAGNLTSSVVQHWQLKRRHHLQRCVQLSRRCAESKVGFTC